MKAFDELRRRLAFNQFLNSMETGLIYEWSMERNTENRNCKSYSVKPIITTKNWTDAFKWNSKNLKAKNICKFYYICETKANLTREDCLVHLEKLKKMAWISLDDMLAEVNSITEIKINKLTWENSECSCAAWLKNYKCIHIIAISCRLELCHFSTVAMAQTIGMKRRQGRPKNTFPALRHQPQETVNATNQEITEDEEEIEEEDEPIQVLVKRIRGRPVGSVNKKKKKTKYN